MTTEPRPLPRPDVAQFDAHLIDGLRKGLDSPTPGALLGMAATLLSITAHPDVHTEATTTVIRGLVARDRVETSAGALAMASLAGDADLRRWARRDIADRGHLMPRWLADLHRSAPVERAVEVASPFRDVDALVIAITMPGGHPLTASVRVDNELGSRDVDGALHELPLETVVEWMSVASDPDVVVRDIAPADARARLEAALTGIDLDAVLGTEDRWRMQRPIVRWMLGFLPAGGSAVVPGSMADVDLDEVVTDFLASPWGRPWTRRSLPLLVEEVLGDGLSNGLGDPLLWSPRNVRRLLSPEPSYSLLEHLDADRTPELLRDLIRYGSAERGLRLELVDRSLAAVDRYADAFTAAIRGWDADAG